MAVKTFQCPAGECRSFFKQSGAYPPSGAASSQATLLVNRNLAGGLFNIAVLMFRMLVTLDSDARVTGVRLKLPILSRINTDARSLAIEWFNTYDGTSNPTAYYYDGTNNNAFLQSITTVSDDAFFALSAINNLPFNGFAGFRCAISGGQPTGKNEIILDPNARPTLEVTYTRTQKAEQIFPLSGAYDRTQALTFQWLHVSPDNLGQGRFVLETNVNSAGWTTAADVNTSVQQWTAPANTFPVGSTVRWRVTTYSVGEETLPGIVSNESQIFMGGAVAIPDVTAPSGVIASAKPNVVHTSAQADRTHWRSRIVRVTDGAVIDDSDEVAGQALTWDRSASSILLAGLTNYRAETQVKSAAGVWSAWGTENFNTVFNPPPNPGVALLPNDDGQYIQIGITNPAPGGGQDNTAFNIIERSDDNSAWEILHDSWPVNTPYLDFGARSKFTSFYRVTAVGTAQGISAVISASAILNIKKGFSIHDLSDPANTILNIPAYNGQMRGAWGYNATFVHFNGRRLPVALINDQQEFDGFEASFVILTQVTGFNPVNQYPVYEALIKRKGTYMIRTFAGKRYIGRIISIPEEVTDSSGMMHGYRVSLILVCTDAKEKDFI